MYAVIKSGASQYRVEVGDVVEVEKLSAEVGDKVEIDEVLLVAGDDGVNIGRPTVEGARVLAQVQGQVRGPKIRVFKYRPKKRYRRRMGHRQDYTRLKIEDIQTA